VAPKHTLAVKSNGAVWGWGGNPDGQVGNGTTNARVLNPVPVQGLAQVTAVGTRGNYSLALKSDGTVWSGGENEYGQLGDGTFVDRFTPVQVQGLTGVTVVVAGGIHGMALKSDGSVWAWDYNFRGQLGDNTQTNRNVPVRVQDPVDSSGFLSGVNGVAVGIYHSLAVKDNGEVWAWGYNLSGQLGDAEQRSASSLCKLAV